MKLKHILSITEARKKIFQIAEEIQKPNTYYTLTQNGKPKAVLMSADQFDSLIETLEVLSDPEAVQAIREHEKNKAEGNTDDYVDWEDVKKNKKRSSKKSNKD